MLEVFRKEIKYSVSALSFLKARPVLEGVLSLDPHCVGGRGYLVRSLYFDSAWDSDLFDVLDGLLSKQKLRVRGYSGDAERYKLEYKCKTGTDSRKESLLISRRDVERLLAGSFDFLMEHPGSTARELYGRMRAGAYSPRVVVQYRRIAYVSALCDVRVTFDYELGVSRDPADFLVPSPFFEPVIPADTGVLEVKYNSFLPQYIKDALETMDASPVSSSKYAQSRLLL